MALISISSENMLLSTKAFMEIREQGNITKIKHEQSDNRTGFK